MKNIRIIQNNKGCFTSFNFNYLSEYKRGNQSDEDFTDYLLRKCYEAFMKGIRRCIK